MCAGESKYISGVHMEIKGQPCMLVLVFHHFEMRSPIHSYARIVSQKLQRDSLVPASCLAEKMLGLEAHSNKPAFHRFWESLLGLHGCMVSTLPTELPSQHRDYILINQW